MAWFIVNIPPLITGFIVFVNMTATQWFRLLSRNNWKINEIVSFPQKIAGGRVVSSDRAVL